MHAFTMYLIPSASQAEKKRFNWGEKFKIETQTLALVSPVAATRFVQKRRGKWKRKPKRIADKQQQQ